MKYIIIIKSDFINSYKEYTIDLKINSFKSNLDIIINNIFIDIINSSLFFF